MSETTHPYPNANPEERRACQLQDRIKAGELSAVEREMLARLVGAIGALRRQDDQDDRDWAAARWSVTVDNFDKLLDAENPDGAS